MMRGMRALVCSVSMAVLLASTAAHAAVTMEVLPLLPGDTRADVHGINEAGTIVGSSYTGTGTSRHAFAWDRSAGLRELPSIGGIFSEARGVNASGQIAGRSADAAGLLHAVLWQPDGSTIDLGRGEAFAVNDAGEVIGTTTINSTQVAFYWSPATGMVPLTAGQSYPHDINAAGAVVGSFSAPTGQRAFSWSLAGGFVDLTAWVGEPANAYGVNDLGQIVGGANGMAYVLQGSSVQVISEGHGAANTAFDINNQGQVYGVNDADVENQRSFFWSASTGYVDLGTLGGKYTSPAGMNGQGRIAGWSETSRKKYHGVYWDPATGLTDLTPGSNVYSYASALNDAGQIAGWTVVQVKKVTKYPPVLWTVTP